MTFSNLARDSITVYRINIDSTVTQAMRKNLKLNALLCVTQIVQLNKLSNKVVGNKKADWGMSAFIRPLM